MQEISFIGQAYKLPSLNAAFQRSLNWYVEIVPGETKSKFILKQRSGQKLFTTVTGVNRKIFATSKDRLFSVNADKLTEISQSGVLTERGTIGTTSGDVDITDNGDEMVIVDGLNGYVFNLLANTLEVISDPDFPDRATHCTYQDGYILVNKPDSAPAGEFYISGIRDALSWGGLDFGNAEGSPDAVTALISTGREIWLMGPDSVEPWYDSGAARFPWQRIDGTYSQIGIFAPFSLASLETNVFWVGGNKQGFGKIYSNLGYKPQRISTHAIEQEIVTYKSIEDAIGFTYQEGGHDFYKINFRAESRTWVYDITTGLWHEEAFTDFKTNTETQYKGNSHAFFKGKNFVADPTSGNIFELDPEKVTDNGNKIKRLASGPHQWNGLDRAFCESVQFDMETGVGLTEGDAADPEINGSNPQGMIRHSDDGGHTFSNQEFADIGKIGAYRTRVKFNRQGAYRDRIWEFSVTDPIKATLLSMHGELHGG